MQLLSVLIIHFSLTSSPCQCKRRTCVTLCSFSASEEARKTIMTGFIAQKHVHAISWSIFICIDLNHKLKIYLTGKQGKVWILSYLTSSCPCTQLTPIVYFTAIYYLSTYGWNWTQLWRRNADFNVPSGWFRCGFYCPSVQPCLVT